MHHISFHTVEAEDTFQKFAAGDEVALGWMYKQLYAPLLRYGRRIVYDEFEVSVMVQESFLHLWNLRSRVTSMSHAYYFMRLVLRWKCYNWHRQRKVRLQVVYTEYIDTIAVHDAMDTLLFEQQYEKKRRLVLQALPYLPPKKQTVLKLYFKYGISHRQIARLMVPVGSAVARKELEKSIDHLRTILCLSKNATPAPVQRTTGFLSLPAALPNEQEAVFRLRYEEKKSFSEIAIRLNLPQPYVEQQYIQAWAHLRRQKQLSTAKPAAHE